MTWTLIVRAVILAAVLAAALPLFVPNCALAQADGRAAPATEHRSDQLGTGETRRPMAPAPEVSPWSIYAALSNGFASNVHFDQEDRDAYGAVLGGGVQYEGDDFSIHYQIAGHRYTNTDRWNRVSHMIDASIERDLSDNWEFEAEGRIALKGTSEDRDMVDQDFEISPRFDYRLTPDRRLRLFTTHRLKRYDDAPETNAFKNYIGVEFRETVEPGRYWELGGRYETNEESADRGDYRRWTYWLEHALPLTALDRLTVRIRYRFRRYDTRLVELDDEDHPRVDHRWIPSISWSRTLSPDFDLRVDYTYESNYSNDPDREYGAHVVWGGLTMRW